ncbi:hypothetical protein Ccrd_018332 [Cynara cardunculus var. scolymus]|uniref:Uncharacterized protein n=1 Tax=Cynara cardunculus var. scolymus TaxID=59895 RepID=A0A103Y6F9_CYNCS|nr:hypothetical protein Ccrd_018332 [Cynara cardunculus var. scolymus]
MSKKPEEPYQVNWYKDDEERKRNPIELKGCDCTNLVTTTQDSEGMYTRGGGFKPNGSSDPFMKKQDMIKPYVDASKEKAKAICNNYQKSRHFASECGSKPDLMHYQDGDVIDSNKFAQILVTFRTLKKLYNVDPNDMFSIYGMRIFGSSPLLEKWLLLLHVNDGRLITKTMKKA